VTLAFKIQGKADYFKTNGCLKFHVKKQDGRPGEGSIIKKAGNYYFTCNLFLIKSATVFK